MKCFLQWLTPFYQAGAIQLLAATCTLLAVIVALGPHFCRWWRRSKLRLEIAVGYGGEWKEPMRIGNHVMTLASAVSSDIATRNKSHHVTVILRNYGKTAAVGVGVVITNFYLLEGDLCAIEPISEFTLPTEGNKTESLPGGLSKRFQICGCSFVQGEASGYRLGGSPGSISGGYKVCFNVNTPELVEGRHLLRLVAFAESVVPTTHYIALSIGPEILLRFATRREIKAVHREDRKVEKNKMSKG